jgi:hypothetical protein
VAVDSNSIVRADLDGSNQQVLVSGLGSSLAGIDYDFRCVTGSAFFLGVRMQELLWWYINGRAVIEQRGGGGEI